MITAYEYVPNETSKVILFREVPELCKQRSWLVEELYMHNGCHQWHTYSSIFALFKLFIKVCSFAFVKGVNFLYVDAYRFLHMSSFILSCTQLGVSLPIRVGFWCPSIMKITILKGKLLDLLTQCLASLVSYHWQPSSVGR